MVSHSTRESVENGEISALAIIETVLSLRLAISVLESWRHVLIGVCLAPFLLLRTERATELGIVSGIQEFGKQVRTEFAFQQPLDIRVIMNLSARKRLRALPNIFEKSSTTTMKSSCLSAQKKQRTHPLRPSRLSFCEAAGSAGYP